MQNWQSYAKNGEDTLFGPLQGLEAAHFMTCEQVLSLYFSLKYT